MMALRLWRKFARFMERGTESVAMLFAAAIMLIMFLATVLRYLAGISLSWSEEVNRLMMVWSVFLVMATVTRNDEHIRMTFFSEKLFRKRAPQVWHLVENVFGIAVFTYLAWVSWRWVMLSYTLKFKVFTTGMPWRYPIWVIQLIVFFAMASVALFYVERLLKQIASWRATGRTDLPVGSGGDNGVDAVDAGQNQDR